MWTYKLIWIDAPRQDLADIEGWEDELSRYGADGWEAVSVIPQPGRWCVVFKRVRRT